LVLRVITQDTLNRVPRGFWNVNEQETFLQRDHS
jgi:hypothetical protein